EAEAQRPRRIRVRGVCAALPRGLDVRTALVAPSCREALEAVGRGVFGPAVRGRSRMTDTDSFDCRAGSQFHHGGGSGRLHACASLLAISLTEWLPAGVALS